MRARLLVLGNNDNNNLNSNNNLNNNARFVGIALTRRICQDKLIMKTHSNLYEKLCTYENLFFAYMKARKNKTKKLYVLEFEKNLNQNLKNLEIELLLHSYRPKPLETFIIRDPKTRKISKSDFRDRIVHHAICNIIEPIFDKTFIHDSYANRKGKGTLKAIKRFEQFHGRESKNFTREIFVLKADIRHYFETVNHQILLKIIKKKINDKKLIWLIKTILSNYKTKIEGKGMPLGNLTSQFFANVYLNELDQYVKHNLKSEHYIRYVDDFVILHHSKTKLEKIKEKISQFLETNLSLQLHPDKSKILDAKNGIDFLGLRIYQHHKLLKHRNIRKFKRRLEDYALNYKEKILTYEKIYDFLEGWFAYTRQANTYNLKKRILVRIDENFKGVVSRKDLKFYEKSLRS